MVAPAHGQSHPGTASLACTVACLACEAVRSSSQVIRHTALVAACARGDADDTSVRRGRHRRRQARLTRGVTLGLVGRCWRDTVLDLGATVTQARKR
jgi:hypothetical protein